MVGFSIMLLWIKSSSFCNLYLQNTSYLQKFEVFHLKKVINYDFMTVSFLTVSQNFNDNQQLLRLPVELISQKWDKISNKAKNKQNDVMFTNRFISFWLFAKFDKTRPLPPSDWYN